MNILELKANVSATDVALRYLGKPQKKVGKRLWYNSPFRTEQHPSFMVDKKSFRDFGDNWHGDIIAFVERYFGLGFEGAVRLLMHEFGITENEYETPKIIKIKKLQQEQRKRKELEVENWFNSTYDYLCNLRREWEDVLNSEKIFSNSYALALNKVILIDYWLDVFVDYSNDKKSLYERRGDIKWILT